MKVLGKIPGGYAELIKCEELAEFVGVILGDGNISKFPRTERLLLVSNANNTGFVKRYSDIIKRLFNKKPSVKKVTISNAVRIGFYQKEISTRLAIPAGSRKKLNYIVPQWIKQNDDYLIAFLRGLFEAEGSLSIHIHTGTYNFQFKNQNQSLLDAVKNGLVKLGFHPEIRSNSIRLRRKLEVGSFKNLIKFRQY